MLHVRLILVAVVCVLHGVAVHAQETPGVDESDTTPAPAYNSSFRNDSGGLRTSPGQGLELPFQESRVLKLDLTRDANDIWDRIRRGFGMPDLDSELVDERQLFYLNRPAFLRTVFERGGQYLYYIVDEIERRGLPTELALLPMVESNYNPLALSRAKASGLWQFIPSTGRNFNLVQDQWVDERRDVIASTTAALDYLEYLYEFHGDWHLALASYNWGEGSVARAIKKNLEQNLPTEYRDLSMPDETRQYIPKLQALKNIVSNPELFNFELPHVANDEHFTTVPAPRGIDLATAARLAEMSMDEFVALNPGYNRPIINSDDHVLIIPADRADQFRLRLSQHTSSNKRWENYQLRKGDTLASVARKHGMSINQLRELNGLDARAGVRVGQTLLVPVQR